MTQSVLRRGTMHGMWQQRAMQAAFTPRDSMGELVFRDAIWLLAGYTPGRVNEVWRSEDGIHWNQISSTSPWRARNLPGAVVFEDQMWILGGYAGSDFCNDVWSSSDGKNWRCATPSAPWQPRGACSVVSFRDKLWLVGGLGSLKGDQHYNDIWTSSDGKHWTLAVSEAPWKPRGMHSLLVYRDRLWLIGGGVYDERVFGNLSAEFNDVWCSGDGVHWLQVTNSAAFDGRRFHSSVVYDDQMWVISGIARDTGQPAWNLNRNDVWRSRDGVNWTQVTPVPWSIRHEPSVVVFRDEIWLIGGFGEILMNDIWSYRTEG